MLAQNFTWTPIASALPASISVFSGSAPGPIYAYYAQVDYADTLLRALVVRSSSLNKRDAVSSMAQNVNAYIAVNGGFFGGTPTASYSLVVSDGKLIDKQLHPCQERPGRIP